MRVIAIENGQFAQNCYLLAEPGSADAALVDPGEEPELFLARAEQEGLTIRAIWLTHAHLDHITGVAAIREATGAPIYLHPDDHALYQNLPNQGRWFGLSLEAPPPVDHWLEHGGTVTLGRATWTVRHAPGHSPGSVLLVRPGLVIGGDVLFQGSIGRTDLPSGDHDQLLQSIGRELLTLPDDTTIWPGHGPPTTVGIERRTNPFLARAER